MDQNPYESPLPDTEPRPTIVAGSTPVWLDMFYLVITAVSIFVLVPSAIVLVMMLILRLCGENTGFLER